MLTTLIKEKDLSKMLKKYSNEWVALSSDENKVLSHGKNLAKVIEEAKNQGEPNPIATRVPQDYDNYVLGM